jgi:acyl carrier protein
MKNKLKKKLLFILKKIKNVNYKKENIFEKFDSIEMLNLISAIEKEFQIKINYLFLNKKNFRDLNILTNLIYKIKNEKL